MKLSVRLGFLVIGAAIAGPATVHAQEGGTSDPAGGVSAAANAFQRAQVAELAGEHERAADLYELADGLAASAPALRGAVRMRYEAGDVGAAVTLAAALQRRYPTDAASQEIARTVLNELRSTVTEVSIHCDAPCKPVVDGRVAGLELAEDHSLYVTARDHSVAAEFDGAVSPDRTFVGEPGQRIDFSFSAPPPPTRTVAEPEIENVQREQRASAPEPSGISPWFFIIGAVATAGVGAVAIWSGFDVLSAHDDYDRSAPNAMALFEDGQSRETRTNVLIGVTAGLAATTLVLAIFTRWSDDTEQGPQLALTDQSALLSYQGRW